MIGLAHGLKVFLCTEPADMRRSFDGLSGMAENLMKQDPLSGHLRKRTAKFVLTRMLAFRFWFGGWYEAPEAFAGAVVEVAG